MSVGKSKSKSSSAPLSPQQVAGYFQQLDRLVGGRLGEFATGGTPATPYEGLTTEQLRALGGAGATRESAAERARRQAIEEIAADPSLTTFQRTRARQLADQDFADRLDAIARETEAGLAEMASEEARRRYEADRLNAALTREDLEALANIFFGGRGQTSSSTSRGFSFSKIED